MPAKLYTPQPESWRRMAERDRDLRNAALAEFYRAEMARKRLSRLVQVWMVVAALLAAALGYILCGY